MCADAARNLAVSVPTADENARTSVLHNGTQAQLTAKRTDTFARASEKPCVARLQNCQEGRRRWLKCIFKQRRLLFELQNQMCAHAARNFAASAPTADANARTSALHNGTQGQLVPKRSDTFARALRKRLELHGRKTAKKGCHVASDAFLKNESFFLSLKTTCARMRRGTLP